MGLFSIIASNKFVASLKTLVLRLVEEHAFACLDLQCTALVVGN
jgi:hypothetical protein